MMISNQLTGSIKALGGIEGFKNDITMLRGTLDRAPLWRPGASLKKQCDEVLRMIKDLGERFERKLVVTLIGPCGSGKSTLLNALAGVDDLSPTGHARPTTRKIVVYSRETGDADSFKVKLGDENVAIRSSLTAASLEHVMLIDTPDTDSVEQDKHVPMVRNAIALSDVLVCVFDSENPKRRDHVDFLAPYVRLFNGDSLVAVINRSDRQDQNELKEKILPEFTDFIKTAWEHPVHSVLCVSARRHLRDPQWDSKAPPRHDFDQFQALKDMIFGTFNRPGYVVDRRLENAKSLRDYIFNETHAQASKDAEMLAEARKNISATEKEAVNDALAAFKNIQETRSLGVNVLLYQKLAQRWLGPVGWLIALWGRILIFGTGIVAMFKFGNPLRQLSGMVSSLRHFKESRADLIETGTDKSPGSAIRDYRLAVIRNWPDIAESLVRCRFDPSVRKVDDILPAGETLNQDLSSIWTESLDNAVEKAARALSGFVLQLFFNLPTIGILVHMGWITAREYFTGSYLPSDFFLHAFLTLCIALFLSFFLFQACARMAAGPERINQKVFAAVKEKLEAFHPISINPVGGQIDIVLAMAESRLSLD
ncbi:MAG: GTPase [Pseudomonadota bacterium]